MFSARWIKSSVLLATLLLVSLGLAGCEGITDDLLPSGEDKQPPVEEGISGPNVGQIAPDFPVEVLDTLGQPRGLYTELSEPGVTAVVLYFTMWCPICDTHMSHMRAEVIPNFSAVKFFLVDYVSGSVEVSRAAQLAYGYGDIETLVDVDQTILDLYLATMGTTVVIDSAGNIVKMNEDYRDGVKLIKTLEAL